MRFYNLVLKLCLETSRGNVQNPVLFIGILYFGIRFVFRASCFVFFISYLFGTGYASFRKQH